MKTTKEEKVIIFTKNTQTLDALAQKKLESGDIQGALSSYLEIEKTGKFPLNLYRKIANLYTDLQMYEKATFYWFKFLNFSGKRHKAEAYNGIAGNFYLAGSKENSAYYFNEQLAEDPDEFYDFDDYMYDLFTQVEEKKPAIRLVDLQGEEDQKNILLAKSIFEKEPEKAYEILNAISPNSSRYENALITLSAFYVIDGKYDLAIEKYQKINSNSELYALALNNLYGVCFCYGDKEQAKQVLKQIKSNDLADFFQLVKFLHVLRSNQQDEVAYEYALSLLECINSPKLYFYCGVSAYNEGKFDQAREWFINFYLITGDYIPKYYAWLCDNAKNSDESIPKSLSYEYYLCKTRELQLDKLAHKYIGLSTAKIRKIPEEIFDFAHGCFACKNAPELQVIACELISVIGGKSAVDYFTNSLLNPYIADVIKVVMVSMLVELGNDKLTGIVYGDVYSQIQFENVEFTQGNSDLFLSAYALAFGKFSPYEEKELYKLKISAYDIYYKLLQEGNLRKVSDITALSALITINAKIEGEFASDDIIEYFGAQKEEVKKIIGLLATDKGEI